MQSQVQDKSITGKTRADRTRSANKEEPGREETKKGNEPVNGAVGRG